MDEADFLCSRVAIMDQGRFVALDTPSKLKDILGGDVVSIEVSGSTNRLEELFNSLAWLKTVKKHGDVFNLTMEKGERRIPEIIQAAQTVQAVVTCVNLRKPSLEDVFLHYTGKMIREEESSQAERNRAMMRGRLGKKR